MKQAAASGIDMQLMRQPPFMSPEHGVMDFLRFYPWLPVSTDMADRMCYTMSVPEFDWKGEWIMRKVFRRYRLGIMMLALLFAVLVGPLPAAASGTARGLDLSSLAGLSDSDDMMSNLGSILELLGVTQKEMKNCKISAIPDQTYTGSAVTPTPAITYNGTRLKKGTDYTISYSNNTKAGTAKATIRGKGEYTGSRTVSFKIVKKGASGSSSKSSSSKSSSSKSASSGSSSGKNNKVTISSASSPEKGALKAGWKKKSGADGYQIVTSTNKDFTSNVTEVFVDGGSKTSAVVEGLASGKNTYVRVRAYKKVGTTYWYSDFSGSRSVKVK